MMTVKRLFMLLFRIVILWPTIMTGCLMMLYFVEVASGGVGRGRGAVTHWPDRDNDAIPQKGGQV